MSFSEEITRLLNDRRTLTMYERDEIVKELSEYFANKTEPVMVDYTEKFEAFKSLTPQQKKTYFDIVKKKLKYKKTNGQK